MNIKGFQFAAVEAAIKKPGRKNLALIFSEVQGSVVCSRRGYIGVTSNRISRSNDCCLRACLTYWPSPTRSAPRFSGPLFVWS